MGTRQFFLQLHHEHFVRVDSIGRFLEQFFHWIVLIEMIHSSTSILSEVRSRRSCNPRETSIFTAASVLFNTRLVSRFVRPPKKHRLMASARSRLICPSARMMDSSLIR